MSGIRATVEPSASVIAELRRCLKTLRETATIALCEVRDGVDNYESSLAVAELMVSDEHSMLKERLEEVERTASSMEIENREFALRNVELEARNERLASLYAATFQLHATLDPAWVLQCTSEILINLVGAAEFVIYLFDQNKGDFVIATQEGDRASRGGRVAALIDPVEVLAMNERRTTFSDELQPAERLPGGALTCTPLCYKRRVIGAFSIYALLSQKAGISQLDRELFELLGEQAALALVSSNAYTSVDRKLRTVQSFMDMLKG